MKEQLKMKKIMFNGISRILMKIYFKESSMSGLSSSERMSPRKTLKNR